MRSPLKPTGVFPMEGIVEPVGFTSRKKLEQAKEISEEAFRAKAKELGFSIRPQEETKKPAQL